MANYSGIDPGKFSPYAAKSRKYQRIGDLFRTFGDLRKEKFLRDRQAAADERALAKHGYQMDIYKARLAELVRAEEEAKRHEEARFKTDQVWAANEATAKGHYWEPTFGVDASPADWGEPDVENPQAHRMVQYGMLPGQDAWPSKEKYLESLAARRRSGRGTSPELAQTLSRLASMRATEALGEGRKAQNIRDAVGGMGIGEDDLYSQASRLNSLAETVKDAINRSKYNELATEDGENVGINQAEKHEMMRTLDTAARVVAQKNKISREAAIRIILQNVEIAKPFGDPTETEWNWGNAFPGGEPLIPSSGFQDFVPKSVEEILDELYKGMPAKDVVSGATTVSQQQSQPQSQQKPVRITSQAELDALPSGTYFKDDSGETKLKP